MKVKRESEVAQSCPTLSDPWPAAYQGTAAYQAPPSMGFSRQEYWSGVPSPPPNLSPGNSKKGSPQVELIYAYGIKVAYGQIHTS